MGWERKRNRNDYDLSEPCQQCPHTLAEHSGMSGSCHSYDERKHLKWCQCESMTWAPDPT